MESSIVLQNKQRHRLYDGEDVMYIRGKDSAGAVSCNQKVQDSSWGHTTKLATTIGHNRRQGSVEENVPDTL